MFCQRLNKFYKVRIFCSRSTSSFFATTPIFYVNAAPHIGHLYSALIADAASRYEGLRRGTAAIHLCTGTDEHGAKIQQAAAQHNVPVSRYCDEISSRYRNVFQRALINYTDFIRTTEKRHKKAVSHFWDQLNSRGFIYASQYSGWYCVSDETFLTDSQLRLDETTGQRYSLESGHPVEWSEENNYMFRLTAIQGDVVRWLQTGNRVRPKIFEKILFDTLSEALPDMSISRPVSRVHWAIPVPGDATQSIYVWLDALINYLTSAGYPDSQYQRLWPPNLQVIGKDILKFHGVFWPAFLIAAGLEPPQQLFVHSHWTVEGQKMSKSKNNIIDPLAAGEMYSMEGLRYFLLREGVAHNDSNYSSTKALRILNAELADTLGNLLSRACAKSLNPQQIYPLPHALHLADILQMDVAKRLAETMQLLGERCQQHYEERNFYLVVDNVISTLHAANNFFEMLRPWELKSKLNNSMHDVTISSACARADESTEGSAPNMQQHIIENARRLETIIAMTMDALRLCGIVLQPIVPQLSGKLLDKLTVPQQQRLWCNLSESFANEHFIKSATIGEGWAGSGNKQGRSLGSGDAVLFRRILPAAVLDGTTDEQSKQSVVGVASTSTKSNVGNNKKQSAQQRSRNTTSR